MLEEKLRQASQSSVKHNKRMVWIFTIVLLSSITLVSILSLFNTSPSQAISKDSVAQQNTSPVDAAELRKAFMTQLQNYETALEPEIITAKLKDWDIEKDVAITSLKAEAISAFGMENYTDAIEKLRQLTSLAQQTLADRDAIFNSEIAAAKQALNDDHYNEGKLHITKALQLKQGDSDAQNINAKLDALPELISLLKRADVARIENNPQKEYASLVKATQLAPDRDDLKQRRDALAAQIKETEFADLIAQGLSHVDKKNITAAQLNYQQAKTLFPTRSEVGILNTAILTASSRLGLQQAKTQAKKAIDQDHWPRAQLIYAKAAPRYPLDKEIRDGLQLASNIVDIQERVSDYINRSERLSSPNIFTAAQDTLMQANIVAHNSPSLTQNMAKLKVLLTKMDAPIEVFVKSDNKTYILVRGVGKVGTTLGRTIQLKAGSYTFEGIRSGYKSKLVEIRLPINTTSYQVEVICDEPI